MTELAALWCSIFACDRATSSWSINLSVIEGRVMGLAYRAFVDAKLRHPEWSRAEQWAEAESMLRSGRHFARGAWRRWR